MYALPVIPDIARRAGYNPHVWIRMTAAQQARIVRELYDRRLVAARRRSLGAATADPSGGSGNDSTGPSESGGFVNLGTSGNPGSSGQAVPMTPQEIEAALQGRNPDGSAMTPAQQAAAQARIAASGVAVPTPRSDFTAPGKRAWWTYRTSNGTYQCAAHGGGVLSTMQAVLRDALRGGWSSYNGSHASRPGVDGNFGPITAAALYAYAKKVGYPAAELAQVEKDLKAKKITPAVMKCALVVTYYMPRKVDLDIGGQRQQTEGGALLGVVPASSVTIPADVVPWKFLERPAADTTAISQQTELPECKLQGQGFSLGQAVLPEAMPGDLGNVPPTVTTTTVTRNVSSGSGNTGILLAVLAGIAIAAQD